MYREHVWADMEAAREHLIAEAKAHLRGLTEREIHNLYLEVMREKANERQRRNYGN